MTLNIILDTQLPMCISPKAYYKFSISILSSGILRFLKLISFFGNRKRDRMTRVSYLASVCVRDHLIINTISLQILELHIKTGDIILE
jgi:hypothetical protein